MLFSRHVSDVFERDVAYVCFMHVFFYHEYICCNFAVCALQYENNSGSCFMQWGI